MGILLAIEPRSERRHTGYSNQANIIKKVESFASLMQVVRNFLGSPWPSYSHVGRLTYIIVERDKASSLGIS
jgi:hypothetical protein